MITTHIRTLEGALAIAGMHVLNLPNANKVRWIWTRQIGGETRYCITTPNGIPHPEPETWHQCYVFHGWVQ